MKVNQVVSNNGNRQAMNQEPDPQVAPKGKSRYLSFAF